MLGINPIALAKKEALKPDFNHNNKPDVLEALDAGEAALLNLAAFLKHFDESDIRAILSSLPSSVITKLPPGAIDEAAKSFAALPPALEAAKSVMDQIENELKK